MICIDKFGMGCKGFVMKLQPFNSCMHLRCNEYWGCKVSSRSKHWLQTTPYHFSNIEWEQLHPLISIWAAHGNYSINRNQILSFDSSQFIHQLPYRQSEILVIAKLKKSILCCIREEICHRPITKLKRSGDEMHFKENKIMLQSQNSEISQSSSSVPSLSLTLTQKVKGRLTSLKTSAHQCPYKCSSSSWMMPEYHSSIKASIAEAIFLNTDPQFGW